MCNRVRVFRESLGFTQAQLARKAGVPRTSVAEIEANVRTPNVVVAIKIARALGATVEEIFGN